ncbi:transcription elongation factor GreA [Demequina sp. B12]|uniref:transcription elongation factor GreA n=1 Tax=Demequina sp. B12 TaxID=2992757 RepID=UPI00237AF5A3|nr:transcription elongation factor GreA [Demequina sp. B12]MDE0573789.1 transcription elongation factor GreA [Demequina sp. B12]
MTETTGTWLTQEALDRLQAEYDHLAGEGRAAIAKEIDERRQEGDLKENGGYHAAREEQAKQEARIEQLRHILQNATVGEASTASEVASGCVVTAEVMGREMRFLVGSREVAGGTDIDVFSAQSPLGSALIGKSAGDETSYTAPNGNEIPVKVITVEPFSG